MSLPCLLFESEIGLNCHHLFSLIGFNPSQGNGLFEHASPVQFYCGHDMRKHTHFLYFRIG